ncbi:MvdC/MvdD family ATP grasp protein [Sciscionella marina]|uniref:MvdC/MvdD family ATP grasp protein n=1 Tax=Sciscionella marina TaxID=508770 RepID=UPI0003643C0D|nr:hypothetical protein [Sciscionella marina]
MAVLILASDRDLTADRLITALEEREAVVHRVNTRWFPARLSLNARLRGGQWVGTMTTPYRSIDLEQVTSVWYRAPEAFALSPHLSGPERFHASMEAKYGLGGMLASLPVFWCSHPSRLAEAAYKPVQLATAARCGLGVPDTAITNEPDTVRAFAAEGPAINKAIGAGGIYEQGGHKFLRTRLISNSDLADLRGVTQTAHLVQRWAPKSYEVRVIVIGASVTAVAIHATSTAAYVDWRTDYDAHRYEVINLPTEVRCGIERLMKHFDLPYGALDFVVSPEGTWTFLELNATGIVDWLEVETGISFSGQLAELLIEGKP